MVDCQMMSWNRNLFLFKIKNNLFLLYIDKRLFSLFYIDEIFKRVAQETTFRETIREYSERNQGSYKNGTRIGGIRVWIGLP